MVKMRKSDLLETPCPLVHKQFPARQLQVQALPRSCLLDTNSYLGPPAIPGQVDIGDEMNGKIERCGYEVRGRAAPPGGEAAPGGGAELPTPEPPSPVTCQGAHRVHDGGGGARRRRWRRQQQQQRVENGGFRGAADPFYLHLNALYIALVDFVYQIFQRVWGGLSYFEECTQRTNYIVSGFPCVCWTICYQFLEY
ncbi:hypothetical protein GRJ2_002721300 [Grus japonensis]|uniref:Uncharacterized protein n=1 Tax=Grus japonensis TaxID=30415 RepID=A0ABC9Y178_GRUJA